MALVEGEVIQTRQQLSRASLDLLHNHPDVRLLLLIYILTHCYILNSICYN